MTDTPHFLRFESLKGAEDHLGYSSIAGGRAIREKAVRIHVRDHKHRMVTPTLEIDFQGFSLAQVRCGASEARRRVFDEVYGLERTETDVGSHPAIGYALGPEVLPDDSDPRQPAVVVWADDEDFYMVASDEMELARLVDAAANFYR